MPLCDNRGDKARGRGLAPSRNPLRGLAGTLDLPSAGSLLPAAVAALVAAAVLVTAAESAAQELPVPSEDAPSDAAPASPDPSAPGDPAPAPSADPAPPEEPPEAPASISVSVQGERAPAGSSALRGRDIREMPGVLGDAYRVIEIQPGVTPTASGFPYFFIRGAPPGNIGYFFDGVQLPLLFHVGGGPSVIPTFMVQRVELHPGPYPADIGRFAGAIVEAESTPASDLWRGEAGLRVGDLGGVIEGPISENLRVLAGGRYSVGAALVSALVPAVDLAYGDYQARVTWLVGPSSRLSLFAFGARDYLAVVQANEKGVDETNVLMDADFHRLDLRYERDSDAGTKIRAGVTVGLDQSRNIGVDRARAYKLAARASVSRPLSPDGVLLRAGLDVAVDKYEITPRPLPADPEEEENELDESFRELFRSRVDLAAGAFADARIPLTDRSTITPGIRADYFYSEGEMAVAVDPKIVGRFGITENIRLIPAVGIASQPPGFAPLPALQIGGLPGGLQRSLQTSFGAEFRRGPIELITTVFRQATFNLTDPIGTGRGTELDRARFLTRSLGDAYGLEIGARGALRRDLLFLVSYTLSRATRRTGGRVIPSAFDRTHVAHAALLYDLGNNWRAGVRHVFYSGFPADEISDGREPSEDPDRVRPFYRFDVRLSKRWKVGERGYLSLIFDIQNATLSKEVFDVACDEQSCTPRTLGPVTIPGLALEGGF